ncbi:MAG: DUF6171 family protein [Defluviitaleaceae bacterium]|nr:DUF6171 family protein [Defluviitaleaceae bacterium]MCL2239317.1 DUF6171 family protein [Defluviitaleaceae bacterium]
MSGAKASPGLKPCPRCLVADTHRAELSATIQDYIKNIPPEHKTTPAVYIERLNICKKCDHLLDGMCVLCGCYVELRAAKALQQCVASASRWPMP